MLTVSRWYYLALKLQRSWPRRGSISGIRIRFVYASPDSWKHISLILVLIVVAFNNLTFKVMMNENEEGGGILQQEEEEGIIQVIIFLCLPVTLVGIH